MPEDWHGPTVPPSTTVLAARSGSARWHDRATWHSLTVPLGTSMPGGAARAWTVFAILCLFNAIFLHFWGTSPGLFREYFLGFF